MFAFKPTGKILWLGLWLAFVLAFIPFHQALADCCYGGVGLCGPFNPQEGGCANGWSHLPGDCPQECNQPAPGVLIQCCICQPTTPGEAVVCGEPVLGAEFPCGASLDCQQSQFSCNDANNNPQCAEWLEISGETEESKPLFIKLNFSIPGSDIFNAGKSIEITGATLGEYIAALYVFFVGAGGILATVMMMWGGLRYVVSGGNPQRISGAKDQITAALSGLIILIASYVLLLTINPNLVKFEGLTGVKPVKQILQGLETKSSSAKGAPPVKWEGGNVSCFDKEITDIAAQKGVDRNWLKAIMLVESSGHEEIVSSAGACGLMQLLPSTANKSCAELKDLVTNITAGADYWLYLLQNACPGENAEHPCNWGLICDITNMDYVIAAYNGGPGANWCSVTCKEETWWQCIGNPGYAETRSYVVKVKQAYANVSAGLAPFVWQPEETCTGID